MKFTRLASAFAMLCMLTAAAAADERRPVSARDKLKYSVSAKAGAVNIVEGDVIYKRGAQDWDLLIPGDELRDGDAVKTGADSRVEVLLNPGSYLRLAGDAQFVFEDTALDRIKINLVKGSAIVEVANLEAEMSVVLPNARYTVIRAGLYRFDVEAAGRSEAAVLKGRLLAGGVEVKEGKRATVEAGAPVVASFNKQETDEFDVWSKERARTLVAANKSLSDRVMRRSPGLAFASDRWFYNPFMGCYTYLPGFFGFSSPYGWSYARYNPYWYYNPRYNGGWVGGTGGGSGQGSGSGSVSGGDRRPGGRGGRSGDGPGRVSGGDRRPVGEGGRIGGPRRDSGGTMSVPMPRSAPRMPAPSTGGGSRKGRPD